jgi:hypothetical protein
LAKSGSGPRSAHLNSETHLSPFVPSGDIVGLDLIGATAGNTRFLKYRDGIAKERPQRPGPFKIRFHKCLHRTNSGSQTDATFNAKILINVDMII